MITCALRHATNRDRPLRLFANDANAAGGVEIAGERCAIDIEYRDDASRRDRAREIYRWLCFERRIDILFGPYPTAATSELQSGAIARMATALAPRSIVTSWNLFGERVSPVTLIFAPIARIRRVAEIAAKPERLQRRRALLRVGKHCPQYFHDDHHQQQVVDQCDDSQGEKGIIHVHESNLLCGSVVILAGVVAALVCRIDG